MSKRPAMWTRGGNGAWWRRGHHGGEKRREEAEAGGIGKWRLRALSKAPSINKQ